MEELGKRFIKAVEEIKNLEMQLERCYDSHEIEISITEAEKIIYSLCSGDASKRSEILKMPIRKALQFYYLNQLKKLNEIESKKSDMNYYVEQKRAR